MNKLKNHSKIFIKDYFKKISLISQIIDINSWCLVIELQKLKKVKSVDYLF